MKALRGWPAPLAADTPGILWSVLDGTLVFLSLDGGRYQISLSGLDESTGLPVTLGLAPEARWPQPLQHSLLDVDSIRALAKGEAIPEKGAREIEALDDGWFHCVNGVWKQIGSELGEAEAAAAALERVKGLRRGASSRALRQCEGEKAKLERGLLAFIEARNARRMGLYERMRERVRRLLVAPGEK